MASQPIKTNPGPKKDLEAASFQPGVWDEEEKIKKEKEEKKEVAEGEKLEEIRGKEIATLRETVEKKEEVSVEVKRREVAIIEAIKLNESLESQKEGLASMEAVSLGLLTKLLAKGFKKEELSDFRTLPSLETIEKAGVSLDNSEKALLQKLAEFIKNPSSPAAFDWERKWPAILKEHFGCYQTAQQVKEDLEDPEKKRKGRLSDAFKDAKEYVKEHPGRTAGFILAGAALAYTGYRLVKWLRGKKSEVKEVKKEEKKSGKEMSEEKKIETGVLGKIDQVWTIAKISSIALVLITVGILIGPEKVREWIKKNLKLDISFESAKKFLVLLFQGKWKEAWEIVLGGVDENADFHAKIAAFVTEDMKSKQKVTGKTLFELKDEKFENYILWYRQTIDEGSLKAREYSGKIAGFLPFDSKKKNEEQIVVRSFLLKHEKEIRRLIGVNEDTTVEEAIQAIYRAREGVSQEELQDKLKEQADESKDVGTIVETEAGKQAVGIDEKSLGNLKERFKNKPAFRQFLEKYKGHPLDMIIKAPTFVNDLFSACHKDSIPVILSEGAIFLLEGDKFLLFSSAKILWDTATTLVTAPFSDEVGWSDSIKTYAQGALTYVVIGAVGEGLITGLFGNKGFLKGAIKGAIKGAGRGFIFPIEIPRLNILAGQRIYRTAEGATFEVRRWLAAEEAVPQILESQARWYGEIARDYDRFLVKGRDSWTQKNWYAWLTQEHSEKLRKKYIRRFGNVYNRLRKERIKFNPSFDKEFPEFSEGIIKQEKGIDFINDFFKKGFPPIEVAKSIDVRGSLFKNPDGKFKTMEEVRGNIERLKTEIKRLKATDPVMERTKLKELNALEAFLDPVKARTTRVLSVEFLNLDEKAKAAKIFETSSELEALEKGTQARFNAEVEKIVSDARLKKLPLNDSSITAKLENLDQKLIIPFAQQKQKTVDALNKAYKELPQNQRTPLLHTQLNHAIEGVEGTRLTRLVKGAKGRAKMMVLMATLIFATDQLIHKNDAEREFHEIMRELGPDMGQLLFDVLPFVGTYSNYHSAFSGKEIVSKRDVSKTWYRASNVIWGTVGLASDILTVVSALPSSGLSLSVNVLLRLTKEAKAGSKTAAKLLQMWPRIERVAERMGGWYEFAKKASRYVGKKPKLAQGLRKIEAVGMTAGTVMLAGGLSYSLYYGFVDSETEIELPKDLQASAEPQTEPQAERRAA